MKKRENIKMAVISGASHALKYRDKNPRSSNEEAIRHVTERMDDMILNAAFLVEQDKLSAFIREIEILKNQYEGTGFLFDCTGPWPPYNFC